LEGLGDGFFGAHLTGFDAVSHFERSHEAMLPSLLCLSEIVSGVDLAPNVKLDSVIENRFSIRSVVKTPVLILALISSSSLAAPIKVATSFSILEDIVQNVGGKLVNITNFVPRNGDAHTYQPTTQDVRALGDAKIVFVNGLGLDGWFEKLAKNAASKAKIVTLSNAIKTQKISVGDETGEIDPHMWWNLQNTITYTKKIATTLQQADPKNSGLYKKNAATYIKTLQSLDAWTKLEVQKISVNNRVLVTNHDALGYFATRYGFKILGTIIPSGGTEREPSAKETAKLIDAIKANKVRALFTENTVNPKLANAISSDTGVKIAPPLYTDSLGLIGSSGESFVKAFRYNVTTIVNALK
jgi:zinc/manganese transport system substrate-binding protein